MRSSTILAFFLFNAGAIAVIGPLDLGPGTTRFYLPLAAGTGLLVCALALRGKFPRWTGVLLVLVYAVFIAGGFLLPG